MKFNLIGSLSELSFAPVHRDSYKNSSSILLTASYLFIEFVMLVFSEPWGTRSLESCRLFLFVFGELLF